MTGLKAVAALFQQVDNLLEDLREQHEAAGEADERDRVERQQKLNGQAYFVLARGQLEAEIDVVCRDATRPRRSIREQASASSTTSTAQHSKIVSLNVGRCQDV